MSKKDSPAPNTILGAVHWYADMHFGTMLWVCQGMLGFSEAVNKDENFLDTRQRNLRDFFGEIELANGMLGLELFMDRDWHTSALCQIDTTLPYGTLITDQQILNLIEDFKEFVKSLPLAKSGDGALVTNPNHPQYHEESNQRWLREVIEVSEVFDATLAAAKAKLRNEGIEVRDSLNQPDDEIPF